MIFDVQGPVHRECIFKYNQQDATLQNSLISVNALHVSGGFSAHHQELKNYTCSNWYLLSRYCYLSLMREGTA
jgi:hypothetical protein